MEVVKLVLEAVQKLLITQLKDLEKSKTKLKNLEASKISYKQNSDRKQKLWIKRSYISCGKPNIRLQYSSSEVQKKVVKLQWCSSKK